MILLKYEGIRDIVRKNLLQIFMEVHIVTNDEDTSDESRSGRFCSDFNEGTMENLNVNLKQLMNYFVQLFYKTGKRYSCARSKLGKLLTVTSFVYARKGYVLFDEDIYKYDDCGTYIEELVAYVNREAYFVSKYYDCKDYIDVDIDEEAYVPFRYLDVSDIDEDVKNIMMDVFRTFGAYSAYELGMQIVPFIKLDGVVNSGNIVDLETIAQLNIYDLIGEDNELRKFLLSKEYVC